MQLIIDLDRIEDPAKREWLISSLELMQIEFHATEKPETVPEDNDDLEKIDLDIDKSEAPASEDLKEDTHGW